MTDQQMTKTSSFHLDDGAIEFQDGDTLLQAAQRAGKYIPHLCYHPAYAPHGNCKLCTVKLNGRFVSSCCTKAEANAQVESQTDELQLLRKQLTQMLFVEGNHHCPFCERSGNCQLQATAYYLGMHDNHFDHQFPNRNIDASHPDVMLDRDRCIMCGLCVSASEAEGKSVFALSGRGADTHLIINSTSGLLKDSQVDAHDKAMHVCPVGALIVKGTAFHKPIGERAYDHDTIDNVGHHTE
ncbi:MAG TPA: ferredoxin [Pseudomonadales bacterium]|nr:ferredoxin [Pseudomonadales bacterium]